MERWLKWCYVYFIIIKKKKKLSLDPKAKIAKTRCLPQPLSSPRGTPASCACPQNSLLGSAWGCSGSLEAGLPNAL